VSTCPSAVHLCQAAFYAGCVETDRTLVDFESKKGEKTVLYKEAFAAWTLHSGNQDSAFIH